MADTKISFLGHAGFQITTENEKIIIIDNVISTGGTLKSVLTSLLAKKVIIKGVFVIVDKSKMTKKIENQFNIYIESLIRIEIIKNKVKLID